jgi:menaquinone-specific isochorismate synthase
MKPKREQTTKTPGQDARAPAGGTPALRPERFQPRFGDLTIRRRGRLPHWEADGATYFVTFRLGDSLPRPVLESLEFERQDTLRTSERQGRQLTAAELKRLEELFSERIEAYLDSGCGACHLANPQISKKVAGALQFFEGQRYRQFAWSVMPNHVHAVFRPLPNWPLEGIMHSWKSFTSKEANKVLHRTGDFWEPEYYDHLVRNEEEFYRYIEYVASNPKRAGLKDWKWVWVRPELS